MSIFQNNFFVYLEDLERRYFYGVFFLESIIMLLLSENNGTKEAYFVSAYGGGNSWRLNFFDKRGEVIGEGTFVHNLYKMRICTLGYAELSLRRLH